MLTELIHFHRHAKKVYEQNTREKILAEEKQSITTVKVTPFVESAASKPEPSKCLLL